MVSKLGKMAKSPFGLAVIFVTVFIILYVTAQITLGVAAGVTEEIGAECRLGCTTELALTGDDLAFCEESCDSGENLTTQRIRQVPVLGFFAGLTGGQALAWVAGLAVAGFLAGFLISKR